jgi:hypothetical protein
MARIDIEIEDYLDEVDTKYLVRELNKREGFKITEFDLNKIEIPSFKTPELLLSYLKKILHLREWHDKKRIINEIESL